MRLLQLLDHRYTLVVTNPPYMGSKNMDTPLRKYVEKYYPSGKRDLYAAFILRCIELSHSAGRVAMITMHGWMFLRNFVGLRAIPDEKLKGSHNTFTGILRETTFEALTHLGRYAFSELGNAVISPVMFTLRVSRPKPQDLFWACRLTAPRPSKEQAALLLKGVQLGQATGLVFIPKQSDILTIPETPLVYWHTKRMIELLREHVVGDEYCCQAGVTIGNNTRFLRKFWEVGYLSEGILSYAKGGGYQKWSGLEQESLLWGMSGERIKGYIDTAYPYLKGNYGWLLKENTFFKQGWCWTLMAQGTLGLRKLNGSTVFDSACPAIFGDTIRPGIGVLLNCRATSYLLRTISSDIKFREGYVARAPLPLKLPSYVEEIETSAIALKSWLDSHNPIERAYATRSIDEHAADILIRVQCVLHSIEGVAESVGFAMLKLEMSDRNAILAETGVPAGWFPLIKGYDTLPALPQDIALIMLPQKILEYLSVHEYISPIDQELSSIKAKLHTLYESGPGSKKIELEISEAIVEEDNEEEEITSGAYIPIPTETFLEELSVKVQLHPISVYWLLEELRAEGVRCKPEEWRLLEDRLSVLVLRLLGYRWPKQLEAEEPILVWVNSDGIMPLVAGTGKATAVEQVRARLRAEDGELGVQQVEMLLAELTGLSLEEWMRRKFFTRHVSQFKHRPVAWHLASASVHNGKTRRGGSRRGPAFECVLYYHACAGDVLARIRTQYVEPLLRAEHQRIEDAYFYGDEDTSAVAHERIQELEAFAENLRMVEEQGFACAELDKLMDVEPLDRWGGDGYGAPASRDDLRRNEQAWRVDINDGVRVNVAPLQLAGVLTSDVLKRTDAKKALADRARWRADERRWVRDGRLSRCGWMDEQVPESQRWTEREPERVAEQMKLEQKRQSLKNKRAEEVEV